MKKRSKRLIYQLWRIDQVARAVVHEDEECNRDRCPVYAQVRGCVCWLRSRSQLESHISTCFHLRDDIRSAAKGGERPETRRGSVALALGGGGGDQGPR